jgi:hypothetical protein
MTSRPRPSRSWATRPRRSRGYGPLRAVLLGGVSHRVAVEARCPVMVLPRGEHAPLEALLAEAHATR